MSITNTANAECHPEWAMGGNPRAIEAQEARGQKELVESSQLPTNGLSEIACRLGIEVLRESPGDKLFSDVKVPTGWRVNPTEHSMWSELVDDNGITRAMIFYRAAFYDRDAFIRSA